MSNVVALVSQKLAELNARNIIGAPAYLALATDPELPMTLEISEICEIDGDTPSALKQRRGRGKGAPFIRLGRKIVYDRFGYFSYLADRYVPRKRRRAADSYSHHATE